MPTNIVIPSTTDLTLDLSIKSSSKRSMSSTKVTTSHTDGENLPTDNDEIKIFGCEKHEEDVNIDDDDDNSDRLSPVIKEEEETSPQHTSSSSDRRNSEQTIPNFFPYFISPYYSTNNGIQTFDKMPSLESLPKYMLPPPPPAHLSNSNAAMDHNTGIQNSIYPFPYSQHWRSPMFPFGLPSGYNTPNPSIQKRSSRSQRVVETNSSSYDNNKSKKSHIKKPLNAFMLFMREQRAQVVQECTLRESAAINQILGRKWHELDRNVQQKYYDMARDERMRHMQLYPGWSARDNYGARKKRSSKGKKRDKNSECLNQKKCRARFGLDQQANWCKHCKRKKKCLRYTENETTSNDIDSWSEEDDTDNIDDSNDCDVIPIHHQQQNNLSINTNGLGIDSDEENKLKLLKNDVSFHHYPYFDSFIPAISNEFKRNNI